MSSPKKPTQLERVRGTSGIISFLAELGIEFVKGKYVSISGGKEDGPHAVVQKVSDLCDAGDFAEARLQLNQVPAKSFVGLNWAVEQDIVMRALDFYIALAEHRHNQFRVLGFVKPTDGTRFGRSPE